MQDSVCWVHMPVAKRTLRIMKVQHDDEERRPKSCNSEIANAEMMSPSAPGSEVEWKKSNPSNEEAKRTTFLTYTEHPSWMRSKADKESHDPIHATPRSQMTSRDEPSAAVPRMPRAGAQPRACCCTATSQKFIRCLEHAD